MLLTINGIAIVVFFSSLGLATLPKLLKINKAEIEETNREFARIKGED